MQRLRHLVVVIPGIGGSVLADADGSATWSISSSRLAASFVRPARLDLEAAPDLRPTALVSTFTSLGGLINIPGYEGLSEHLRRSFRAPVVHCYVPGTPVPNTTDVLLFPYDFRRSVRAAAVALADAVNGALADVLPSVRRRRVIIIAHSMGGLVARYWLGPLGGARDCLALLTLGTPHRGAPKALDWLVNGAALGRVRLPWLTRVLRGWPSVYELLPQYPAVWDAQANAPVEMAHLRPDVVTATPTPDGYASTFSRLAEAGRQTHEDIAAAWDKIELPVVPFFGRGHATTNRLELTPQGRLVASKEDPGWRSNVGWRGDGTVPVISAIPRELGEVRELWRGVADRHMDFASTGAVIDVLTSFTGEALPTRGTERPDRPWLGLDVEEAVAVGDPVPIGVVVQPEGTGASAVHVSVRHLGALATPTHVEELEDRGGEWRATLPPLAAGRHRLSFEAQDVAGPGSVFADADIVALDVGSPST